MHIVAKPANVQSTLCELLQNVEKEVVAPCHGVLLVCVPLRTASKKVGEAVNWRETKVRGGVGTGAVLNRKPSSITVVCVHCVNTKEQHFSLLPHLPFHHQ